MWLLRWFKRWWNRNSLTPDVKENYRVYAANEEKLDNGESL